MIESFFVTLREIGELLFIVLAVHGYLAKIGKRDLFPALYGGVFAGTITAIAGVFLLLVRPLEPAAEGALSLMPGLSVLCMALAFVSSQSAINQHVHDAIQDRVQGRNGAALIFGFTALAAFRETLEVGLFLRTLGSVHGYPEAIQGGMLGLLAAGALALSYHSIKSRVPLQAMFRLSALLLCLISIQMIICGLGTIFDVQPEATRLFERALTPGSSAYQWLCAALMSWPVAVVIRSWWREANRV